MSKSENPLFRKTSNAPVEPDVLDIDDDSIVPLNESFPGMPPMSVREKKRLAELEDVVTRNFKAFYEVGCALREINTSMLYRSTHSTFAGYAKDLWDIQRAHAYRMIDAADIVDRLLPYAEQIKNVSNWRQDEKPIPQNEAQARALVKYPEEKQIEIWRKAVETADGRITAAHIKQTARKIHGEKVKTTVDRAKRKTNVPAVKMSDRFRKAFNEFLDAINEERLKDWKDTDPTEAQRHIEGILQAISQPL